MFWLNTACASARYCPRFGMLANTAVDAGSRSSSLLEYRSAGKWICWMPLVQLIELLHQAVAVAAPADVLAHRARLDGRAGDDLIAGVQHVVLIVLARRELRLPPPTHASPSPRR